MARSIILYPTVASFLLFVPLVFVALYLGAPLIADVIKALEGTVVIHILEVVGGGLAAIGIATTVYVIGRKDYLVFFFLAYFMSVVLKSLDITMVTYAIFGIIIALIFVQSQKGNKYSLLQAITIQHLLMTKMIMMTDFNLGGMGNG